MIMKYMAWLPAILALSISISVAQSPDSAGFAGKVKPFLQTYCTSCHGPQVQKGDLTLHDIDGDLVQGQDIPTWTQMIDRLTLGEMPPHKARQPKQAERERMIGWIRAELHKGGRTVENKLHRPGFGNYVQHELLFGENPVVPSSSPPRVWRIRPAVYDAALQKLAKGQYSSPFTLRTGDGFRDFDNQYKIGGADLGLLLANARQSSEVLVEVIARQGKLHRGPKTPQQIFELIHPANQEPTSEQIDQVIDWLYSRVLLRNPTPEERRRLAAFARRSMTRDGRILGVRNMVAAVLLTPEALYRLEVGQGKPDQHGRLMLAPRELAFAIAYALTDRRPDGLLLKAAETGKLTTREAVRGQVERILNDRKISKPRILEFFREYFEYVGAADVFKDRALFPDHDAKVLVGDTDQLVMYFYERDKDVLRELLTTRKSFVQYGYDRDGQPIRNGDSRKASYLAYSLPLDWKWVIEQPIDLPVGQRAGVLTQPAWLVAKSDNFDNHAIRRGLWIRHKLLGGTIPDLPITVDAQLPNDASLTLRQRMQVTEESYCWKCHRQMNPLGLTFELYDHFGRWRTRELGKPVNTTGAIAGSGETALNQDVSDPIELVHRLAGSTRVRQVFIRHVFRFWMGRNETPADAATLRRADEAYVQSGGSMKTLVGSLLTSDSFLYRKVTDRETADAP